MDRIEDILWKSFRPFSPEWPNEAGEYCSLEKKLDNIRETAAGFSEAESAVYEAMLARLRNYSGRPGRAR